MKMVDGKNLLSGRRSGEVHSGPQASWVTMMMMMMMMMMMARARFRSFGGLADGQLVAGPWDDLSPHLHQLLKLFAESRVTTIKRAQGYEVDRGDRVSFARGRPLWMIICKRPVL